MTRANRNWSPMRWGLSWRREHDGRRYTLHQGSRKSVLVSVEPDAKWPGMWRVRKPDGSLTDMVNLTRAKDAAMSIAANHLNLQQAETPPGGPPIATGRAQSAWWYEPRTTQES
jgi:hypothetical protein